MSPRPWTSRRSWSRLLASLLLVAFLAASARAQEARKIVLVAGAGKEIVDGGRADKAKLLTPYGVGFDAAGNMYIGEIYGHRVRKVTPEGTISTIAGTSEKGYSGDGGPALAATFWEIHDLCVAENGDVYVADSFNYRIRKIDAKSGTITLVAGTGKKEITGDGGPAHKAGLDGTACVVLDPKQEKLYTTGFSKRVRVIDLKSGIIDTVAGIAGGRSVAVDSKGRVYVGKGDAVSVLEPGAAAAKVVLDAANTTTPIYAAAMCVDRNDNLYIADMKSQTIRRYEPATGKLTILAGKGKRGKAGLGGPALEAEFADPHGINIRPDGSIVFADSFNYRVVRIEP